MSGLHAVTRTIEALSDAVRGNVRRTAQLIAQADALIITAGAGMGVDSGLPDFRGNEGFWKAYPALGKLRVSFADMARPEWFARRPGMAWGFYGHRQALYRNTMPHRGFSMLRDWVRAMSAGYFVVTSNVDGQFEKAGFEPERMLEQHGNIHWLQCTEPCSADLWPFGDQPLDVDLDVCEAHGPLPMCPNCGAVARPNVLMFEDYEFVPSRWQEQQSRYRSWLAGVRHRRLVILEIGAGVAIPTIRRIGEQLAAECERATLVRINPQARLSEELCLPIALGALEALTLIESELPEDFQAGLRAS